MDEIESLKEKIKDLDYKMFLEEMADYLDWKTYTALKLQKQELENKLRNLEGAVSNGTT